MIVDKQYVDDDGIVDDLLVGFGYLYDGKYGVEENDQYYVDECFCVVVLVVENVCVVEYDSGDGWQEIGQFYVLIGFG